jgi:hypothetical protein
VDVQIADVLSYLSDSDDERDRAAADDFTRAFPEYNGLVWSGSWVDAEASGVDVEYMSWVAEWLDNNTRVSWAEGEPVIGEPGDEVDED